MKGLEVRPSNTVEKYTFDKCLYGKHDGKNINCENFNTIMELKQTRNSIKDKTYCLCNFIYWHYIDL